MHHDRLALRPGAAHCAWAPATARLNY